MESKHSDSKLRPVKTDDDITKMDFIPYDQFVKEIEKLNETFTEAISRYEQLEGSENHRERISDLKKGLENNRQILESARIESDETALYYINDQGQPCIMYVNPAEKKRIAEIERMKRKLYI